MAQQTDVRLLANRHGKKALPAFLPYALCRALWLARRGRIRSVHLADALLAPLGATIKALTGVPVTSSVCGLDVTYPNRLYQSLIPRALGRLDMTMPISRATEAELRVRAGEAVHSTVVPLGVNPLPEPSDVAVREFERLAGLRPDDRVLLTVGRLIKRKGVAWFAEHALPLLPDNVLYAVIGDGDERQAIESTAARAGMAGRLRMLGRVDEETLAAAYRRADVFVMPNVPVPGDMEGFGLVALEAAASGLPVVAAALEGITEAVQHGRNGLLVAPGDHNAFASTIDGLLRMPASQRRALGRRFADYTNAEYSWERAATRYVELIDSLSAVPVEIRRARAA
jgi:glycosyltransferase involved in cell wall biosynthesis